MNVEDDSVGAAILLYDREVQRISGKNVYEVFMEQKKVMNYKIYQTMLIFKTVFSNIFIVLYVLSLEKRTNSHPC